MVMQKVKIITFHPIDFRDGANKGYEPKNDWKNDSQGVKKVLLISVGRPPSEVEANKVIE